MKKKNNIKTIGEMTQTRRGWEFNASTRVKLGKKGKGSYNRKNLKYREDEL